RAATGWSVPQLEAPTSRTRRRRTMLVSSTPPEGGKDDFKQTVYAASFYNDDSRGVRRQRIRAVRPHFACRGQAGSRLLGPLGARRERHAHQDLQRVGGE